MKKNPTFIVLLLLCLVAMPGFCFESRTPDFGFIEVTGGEVRLPVPDARRVFGPGDSAPLLQENPEFFIIALPNGSPAVVSKFDRKGNPIAWVTQQKQLIFGEKVRATSGFLHLRAGDEFRILRDTPNTWVVEFSAFQNRAELSIPKQIPSGLTYIPPETGPGMEKTPSEPVQVAAAKPVEKPVVRTAPKPRPPLRPTPVAQERPEVPEPVAAPVETEPPEIELQSATATPAAQPVSQPVPALAAVESPVPAVEPEQPEPPPVLPPEIPEPEQSVVEEPESPEPTWVAEPATEIEAASDAAAATDDPAAEEEEEPPEEKPAASSAPTGPVVRFLDKYMLSIYILLLIVIVEGLFIVRLRRKGRTEQPAAARTEEPVAVLPRFDTGPFKKYFQSLRASTGQISGPFGSFTTYELVYYLHTAKETGGLELEQHKGMVSAEMFFSNGEIVHAFVGNKVDDEAVLEILCKRCEVFNYTHLPVIIEQHTIHNPTVNFLIAAAPASAQVPAEAPAEAETPAAETETEAKEPAQETGGEAKAMLASLLEDEGEKPAQKTDTGDEGDPEWDEIMKSLKVLDDMNDKPK